MAALWSNQAIADYRDVMYGAKTESQRDKIRHFYHCTRQIHEHKAASCDPTRHVDCLRKLTRENEPADYARSLAKMAHWCAQFDYTNLDGVISNLKKTNAMEESLTRFQLLNIDGSRILPE